MAKKVSKSKKVSPASGAKKMSPQLRKAQAPLKRKQTPSGVEDPFGGDPFELPRSR
jgi:hypothetical protein